MSMPVITIIGPYDYGKSTLLGKLLLDSKSLPANLVKNVMHQCKLQGIDFHPSYLIDHIREERELKSTRERALAELKIGRDQVLIIDTPGQLSLSKKMISQKRSKEDHGKEIEKFLISNYQFPNKISNQKF